MKNTFFPVFIVLLTLCVAFRFTYYTDNEPTILGKAPEITMVSPKGKTLKLSKLRGKLVLIDFWASWCGPCRKEMPNVVEAYNKYKKRRFTNGKGFTVFSVSLDRESDAWKAAIKSEGMDWTYHGLDENNKISDLYGVNSIPTAFLIDGSGEIIAKANDLRGINLHITLDKYLAE